MNQFFSKIAEHGTQIPLLKYSPGRVLYYKKNLIEIGDPQLAYSPCKRDGEAEPQSLVSIPNIPGLNPKSLCTAYDVKAYYCR